MIRNALVARCSSLAAGAGRRARRRPRPELKAKPVITGDIVRIGDLVENAGIVADVPIFRAPDLGSTGTVSADAVVEAVRAHALIGLDTGGLQRSRGDAREPRDRRRGHRERASRGAVAAQFALGDAEDIALNFDRELRTLNVEPTPKASRASRASPTMRAPAASTPRSSFRRRQRARVAALTGRARRDRRGRRFDTPARRAARSSRHARRVIRAPPARRSRPRRRHRPRAGGRPRRAQRAAAPAGRCAAPT